MNRQETASFWQRMSKGTAPPQRNKEAGRDCRRELETKIEHLRKKNHRLKTNRIGEQGEWR
jgi:plasmid stabilization system protein ParE